MTGFPNRWAWAEVYLDAIEHNVRWFASRVSPSAVMAVVKANAYGHGSVEVSRAALRGGATTLCVALVEEALVLRDEGISEPILLLSEQPHDQAHQIASSGVTATITSADGVDALETAWAHRKTVGNVHLKVDTGMHRVGVAPREAVSLAKKIIDSPHLRLVGVYTHFAVADDPAHEANRRQVNLFGSVLDELRAEGINPGIIHASNSAATLNDSSLHLDAVRLGIAMYGLRPSDSMTAATRELRPALSLRARVSATRWVDANEAVSYGLHKSVNSASLIATIPIGYADGVPRGLWKSDVGVLINGRRRPFAGTITMDQLMVDCGSDSSVSVGDEAVLIGSQGDDSVEVSDWARAMNTIDYEIVCGISSRIDRRYR